MFILSILAPSQPIETERVEEALIESLGCEPVCRVPLYEVKLQASRHAFAEATQAIQDAVVNDILRLRARNGPGIDLEFEEPGGTIVQAEVWATRVIVRMMEGIEQCQALIVADALETVTKECVEVRNVVTDFPPRFTQWFP